MVLPGISFDSHLTLTRRLLHVSQLFVRRTPTITDTEPNEVNQGTLFCVLE